MRREWQNSGPDKSSNLMYLKHHSMATMRVRKQDEQTTCTCRAHVLLSAGGARELLLVAGVRNQRLAAVRASRS